MGCCLSSPKNVEKTREVNPVQDGATGIQVTAGGEFASAQIISSSDLADLPEAQGSYGKDEVRLPATSATGSAPTSDSQASETSVHAVSEQQGDGGAEEAAEEGNDEQGDEEEMKLAGVDVQELLKQYTLLAELLSYSPYPVTLIDIEKPEQPFVFVNQVSS